MARRLLVVVLLSGIGLALPGSAGADPLRVSGGVIVFSDSGLIPNPFFVLEGANFTFKNTDSEPLSALQWPTACSSAASGAVGPGRCQAGDTVNLSFSVTRDLGAGPGTIDGRQFDQLTYRGTLSAVADPVVFRPRDEEAFGFASASTPYVFAGLLRVFDGERELFAHALTGRGIATMTWENEGERAGGHPVFIPSGDGDNGPVYDFTVTPEPGSLL